MLNINLTQNIQITQSCYIKLIFMGHFLLTGDPSSAQNWLRYFRAYVGINKNLLLLVLNAVWPFLKRHDGGLIWQLEVYDLTLRK